jgi:carbonic anhydrase/acetyltransferase-like protein (isoleucine patch superfamily)
MQYRLGELHPIVHPTAWIAQEATVVGQVNLEAGVSIWFGAVVRADNDSITIGQGSNVQEGAVIHVDPGKPCQVGRHCVIGHRAVLHGCRLGDEVLVGIGAIVLNGAVLPDGCLVGAGALVPEGKVLESGCLYVGVPARKVRALTEQERAGIRRNAEGYIVRARRFAEHLHSDAG